MPALTSLEAAAIRAIMDEASEWSDTLARQLQLVQVLSRENTGGGFFTDLRVPEDAPGIHGPSYFGQNVHAAIRGLSHGIGLILFLRDGRMDLLEGYAVAGEDTSPIDFEHVDFRITDEPSGWTENVR